MRMDYLRMHETSEVAVVSDIALSGGSDRFQKVL